MKHEKETPVAPAIDPEDRTELETWADDGGSVPAEEDGDENLD